ILGSPIYFGTITGEMKSFLERAAYPYLTYTVDRASLFPKKIPTGFIYTMGADENRMKELQIDRHMMVNQMITGGIFGSAESLIATDTYQFEDYSKYVTTHDPVAKAKRRQEVFPLDCQKAFDMGVRFAKK
ncbi:MAG TPA: hypothetical protein VGJ92_09150, partial [Methanocella sp.]